MPVDHPSFYGRRHGHRLSPTRRHLLEEMLPLLRVPRPRTEDGRLQPRTLFAQPMREVWLEIGFGGGEHLAAQARAHPDVGIIGCEPFVNGIANLLAQLTSEGTPLESIRVFDDDAGLLLPTLAEGSIDRLFLLFADPWPKSRHHKRRFVNPDNLDLLARVLADGAEFRFASDHLEYVRWTFGQVSRHPLFQCAANTREPPPDWVATRYETKALREGRPCVYLGFRRMPRTGGLPPAPDRG